MLKFLVMVVFALNLNVSFGEVNCLNKQKEGIGSGKLELGIPKYITALTVELLDSNGNGIQKQTVVIDRSKTGPRAIIKIPSFSKGIRFARFFSPREHEETNIWLLQKSTSCVLTLEQKSSTFSTEYLMFNEIN